MSVVIIQNAIYKELFPDYCDKLLERLLSFQFIRCNFKKICQSDVMFNEAKKKKKGFNSSCVVIDVEKRVRDKHLHEQIKYITAELGKEENKVLGACGIIERLNRPSASTHRWRFILEKVPKIGHNITLCEVLLNYGLLLLSLHRSRSPKQTRDTLGQSYQLMGNGLDCVRKDCLGQMLLLTEIPKLPLRLMRHSCNYKDQSCKIMKINLATTKTISQEDF
ncbi:hypothetical protein BDA99DRAFT_575109 [Phascolomyces articulosus]|uniref:Uncharacterized protein n=1 Tax=Phascolomyces articulosus TaxID=60185 RepID=A0AAD5K196_9FUNG|nr:hypothetical protein BDA99DRAFT_575109 [Phascolomyces articulosus]